MLWCCQQGWWFLHHPDFWSWSFCFWWHSEYLPSTTGFQLWPVIAAWSLNTTSIKRVWKCTDWLQGPKVTGPKDHCQDLSRKPQSRCCCWRGTNDKEPLPAPPPHCYYKKRWQMLDVWLWDLNRILLRMNFLCMTPLPVVLPHRCAIQIEKTLNYLCACVLSFKSILFSAKNRLLLVNFELSRPCCPHLIVINSTLETTFRLGWAFVCDWTHINIRKRLCMSWSWLEDLQERLGGPKARKKIR